MLHSLSVDQFGYISDFEWLKPIKFYRLMIQLAKGQGHLLNLTWHPKCLDRDGRGICGLTLILECLEFGTKIVQIIKCYMTKFDQ